jgi:hypothetical protein
MSDDDCTNDDTRETVSTLLNTLVERIVDEQDVDDMNLAKRIGKRSLLSTVNTNDDRQQMKRTRNNQMQRHVST